MTAPLLPWQDAPWRQLRQMRDRLPHAILFHGPAGIGKTAFAERFAQSLLCQAPVADHQPCGRCDACGWFDQYSHPDYRRVRPELLDEEAGADAGEGEAVETRKAGKAKPSKEIKIDQVRALADFMSLSTHRQGMRVVVLYPAEALNTAAANALLKTLEEPPPATIFLLVSDSIERLLPTILSRCRKFGLALPSAPDALAWLQEQGVADADVWLAEQGGAPLAAQRMAQADGREVMDILLQQLARPDTEGALRTAEKLQKASVPDLVAWQQRWLYDMFSFKLSGRIRYYPRYRKQLSALSERADSAALLRVLKAVQARRAVAEHPLAARLFIEDMLLEYTSVFG